MSKGNTAYASGVHRYYALRKFCVFITVSATTWVAVSGYHAYVVINALQPHQKAHFGTLYRQCFLGAFIAMLLFGWMVGQAAVKMRYNWDRAMVSNLANNIGGNLPARTRQKIAAIIVSQNK